MTTEKPEEKTTKTVPPPRLRFKQFEGQGEWEEKRLREVCEINPGGERIPASFIYIDLEAVSDGKLHCERVVQRNDAPSRAQRVLKSGDIIFQTVRPYQKNNLFFEAVNDEYRYVASTGYAQLRARGSEKFLYYSVLEDGFVERVIAKCTGSNYPAINSSDLSDITLFTTSLPEQQHIAATLSSLDDLITAHADKLEALRQHKRGLMQQLFPAEGERVPERRFPEFAGAGEWEKKRLGEISDIKTGPFGSILHQEDYVNEGTPIVTVEHLNEFGISGKNAPKVSDKDKQRLLGYRINVGDIVFSRVGSVDRCSIARQENDGWLFSGRLLRLRIRNRDENIPEFLNQVLKIESNKSEIRNAAVGQTMASLNTEILKGIAFLFPTLPEQQRIADCLSSLDDLISAQADKVAALEKFKRGLMQGLFPSTTAAAQEATE